MDTLLALGRLSTYTGALQLFGVAAFQYWLAAPGLRVALDHRARQIARVSAVLLIGGQIAWLAATAGLMADGWASAVDPATLSLVLTETAFGRSWGILMLAGLLAGIASFSTRSWRLPAYGSGLLLAGFSFVGHATIGLGIWAIVNHLSQAIHLISASFWLGALLPLLLSLTFFLDDVLDGDAEATLRRFSGLGHFAVAALMLSGVANSWFVVEGQFDLTVPYQQLLLLKAALACTMCCLALINRYVFVPAIPDGGPGLRQLMQGTIAEIVIGASVVGLVSVIGTMSPS